MASNHYSLDAEIEVKVKIKVTQINNYHSMSDEEKENAVLIIFQDIDEIVVDALNGNKNFQNYDLHLGVNGAADSYNLEAFKSVSREHVTEHKKFKDEWGNTDWRDTGEMGG